MKFYRQLIALTIFSCFTSLGAAEPIKAAVFRSGHGAQAVFEALKQDSRLAPKIIREITTDSLLPYDVLYLGSGSVERPEQIKGLKVFVSSGGGVIFNHSACGRSRPQTILPEIALKVLDRREDSVLVVQDPAHPLTAGLPAEFTHAFNDHLYLEPGEKGKVILTDREGGAVAIAGAVGQGRVIFNGSLPGYWYDPADYAQGEKPPEGDELQWVVNSLLWLAGEERLSQLPEEELVARRAKAESDLKTEELSLLLPNANWFGSEMLRGSYLTLPPVTEIGGRFFITYDTMSWRRRDPPADESQWADFFRQRIKQDVLQLKWLGITDIVFWTDMSGDKIARPSNVPHSDITYKNFDVLAELIRAATPEGINVWAAWHSCSGSEAYGEVYGARDAEGKLYMYGNKKYVEDLLKPDYLNRCRMVLDEYVNIYKPLGNFKGLFTLDELWFLYADFHGDDLETIEEFCLEKFGEKLPADFAARLNQGRRWNDPLDPWRRRYILFKQKVMTDFFRDLLEACHERGLEMGVTTIFIPDRWFFGMDNQALSRLNPDYLLGGSRGYPRSLQWTHIYDAWGAYTTKNMLGGPGGAMFTFNHIWRPIMFGNDPYYVQHFARHIYAMRMFADSKPQTHIAVLENQPALDMLTTESSLQFNRLATLVKAVQNSQTCNRIYSTASELYQNYRVLIGTQLSGRGLPAETLADLRRFVADGGHLISLDADWSTARSDMENEVYHTADLLGVEYGDSLPSASLDWKQTITLSPNVARRQVKPAEDLQVVACFSDGTPAITERKLGGGKVTAFHFDVSAELEQANNQLLQTALNGFLAEAARPAVGLEASGPAQIQGVLKKGNWLAVTLLPEQPPASVSVTIDTAALGLPGDKFRVLLLARQMELARPGDLWGTSGFWTAKDLAQGVRLTLTENQTRDLPLPEQFDFSDFPQNKRGKQEMEYADRITRSWWDMGKRGKVKRDYSHEILVIAPADEAYMPPAQ